MATTGLQRLVRRAVLARLKADAALTALVPAARIYPQAVPGSPVWPFIKLGPPLTLPFSATCAESSGTVSLDVHAFARARESGGTAVETAEDHASRIGAAIEASLHRAGLTLEGDETARVRLSDIQLLQDDEPDAFHYLCRVNARVLAA